MATPGLRERKKLATRALIAERALALFVERGYDAVTVEDVAQAANVAKKTVFNYFPTKEDLVFDQDADLRAEMLAAVAGRRRGTSPLAALRTLTLARLDHFARVDAAPITGFATLVATNRALTERLRTTYEGWIDELTELLAGETGRPPEDLETRVVADALLAPHRAMTLTYLRRLAGGADHRELAHDLRDDVARAYARLERGLATVPRAHG